MLNDSPVVETIVSNPLEQPLDRNVLQILTNVKTEPDQVSTEHDLAMRVVPVNHSHVRNVPLKEGLLTVDGIVTE